MTMMLRVTVALAGAMALTGCALLGGGPKPPPWLLTLAPSAPAPASVVRSANAGEAVTIEVPVIPWPEPPKRLLRISAQLYIELTDYEKLAAALLLHLSPAKGVVR